MDELKARSTKLESDNQELKQNNARLRQIAIKYRTTATAAAGTPAATTPTPATPASTSSIETDDLLPTGTAETPAVGQEIVEKEKLNRLKFLESSINGRSNGENEQTS